MRAQECSKVVSSACAKFGAGAAESEQAEERDSDEEPRPAASTTGRKNTESTQASPIIVAALPACEAACGSSRLPVLKKLCTGAPKSRRARDRGSSVGPSCEKPAARKITPDLATATPDGK